MVMRRTEQRGQPLGGQPRLAERSAKARPLAQERRREQTIENPKMLSNRRRTNTASDDRFPFHPDARDHPADAGMDPEADESSKLLVFVHGTLRAGQNQHKHLERARFIGKGRTKEQYALYVGVSPYVVKSEKVSWIVGEVYEIDQRTLRRLDLVEQCPCWQSREWVDVLMEKGQELRAMMYFARERKKHLVLSGDFSVGY